MTMEDKAPLESWDNVPMIEVYRPACPYCEHEGYIPIRSTKNGDGSTTKRAVCKGCSRRYIVIREPLPKFGNHITWPGKIEA